MGAATNFEVRGVRQEASYFTSFYLYSLTRGIRQVVRGHIWPRITCFDDRWRWLVASIIPRFRRFDADVRLVDASLRGIFDEARDYASNPCVLRRLPQPEESLLTTSERDDGTGVVLRAPVVGVDPKNVRPYSRGLVSQNPMSFRDALQDCDHPPARGTATVATAGWI